MLEGYYALMCLLQHNLQIAMVKLALQNEGLIVPGYTHLQRAQPVLLQHLLLAYVEQVSTIWLTSLIMSYTCYIILILYFIMVVSGQLAHTVTILPPTCIIYYHRRPYEVKITLNSCLCIKRDGKKKLFLVTSGASNNTTNIYIPFT